MYTEGRILASLHTALLLKLKVIQTFLLVMRVSLLEFSRLGLHLLEIESLAQAVNLFASLYATDILTQSLLRVMIILM